MAKNNQHRVDEESFRRYLSGKMTPAERHAFEKALLDDPFAHEALEGMEAMNPEHIAEDLKALNFQLVHRTHKKQRPIFWRIAAGLLLLGIFSFVIYYFIDTRAPSELAQEKQVLSDTVDATSPIKSEVDSTLTKTPDQIIAYQQSPDEVKATKSSPKPDKMQQNTAMEENKEAVQAFDYSVEPEADIGQMEEETTEAQIAEIPVAAPESVIDTEMKKAETPPAQKRKANTNEQRSIAGAVAIISNERTIKGKVTSLDDDSPTPGVNVVLKGSSTGTVTDIDGNYEITVPATDETILVFSSIGYTTEEVELDKNETVVDVSLGADVTALSEIVVTGYGTSTKEIPPYSFTPPKPIGGQAKFKDYINENLRYPVSGLATGVKGSVRVQFTIKSSGTMTDLRIIRSLGEDFDNEALRLIKNGPKWQPAEENGTRVDRDVKVTIRFKPPE